MVMDHGEKEQVLLAFAYLSQYQKETRLLKFCKMGIHYKMDFLVYDQRQLKK